jgi:hypothetical protein
MDFRIDHSFLELIFVVTISVSLLLSIVFLYLRPEETAFKDIAILLIGIGGGFIGAKLTQVVES